MKHEANRSSESVVLSAMDKFRGTATSREIGGVVEAAVASQGLLVDVQSMSDGGEGFVDAFDGEVVSVEAPGPLLEPVVARVKIVPSSSGATAVIEVSDVVGRDLLPAPSHREALAASSEGVGVVILAAVRLGVDAVLVSCGGTATSDGGLGCYRVLAAAGGLPVAVTAATDITAHFSGVRRYALQKSVRAADLGLVDKRLHDARAKYLAERGVDVEGIEGSGAAGGISGALAALGAVVISGVDAVARSVNLGPRIARSSLVITGEGRFDEGSLEGKVVVGVAELVDLRVPLLVVCGSFNDAAARTFRRQFTNARIFSLEDRFGLDRALDEVRACVDAVVREEVPRFLRSSLA
jgi:glycerate kinase